MARRSVTIRCAEAGCPESAFYEVRTKAEDLELRRKPWRCTRHRNPEEVLALTANAKRSITLVCHEEPYGMFWREPNGYVSSGFKYGPGFQAHAEDFPVGARLTVTATVEPPLADPINSACANKTHDRCSGDTYIGHSDGQPVRVPCECECHRIDMQAGEVAS